MIEIPTNYYSNLSCYEDFVLRTNLLGYNISDSELYDCLNHFIDGNIRVIYNSGLYFFAIGDDNDRHLCIIDRKGNHIEHAIIEGDFDCSYMKLTSLKGAPREVGGSFDCSFNKLTSLEGVPQKVNGYFDCSDNKLTSLEGAPREVSGYFECSGCDSLTSLQGAPEKVSGDFSCVFNKLTTLKGAPLKVGGYFICSWNNLTSLEGAPVEIGGDFNCTGNNLDDTQVQTYKDWLKTNPTEVYHDLFAN